MAPEIRSGAAPPATPASAQPEALPLAPAEPRPGAAAGRTTVTVFTLTWCKHCARVKALLATRAIAYTEIDIGSYPDRRADMVRLSNRTTVPQVFVGARHVGGASDLEKMIEAGGFDTALAASAEGDSGTIDPGFAPPDGPPVAPPKEALPRAADESIGLGAGAVTHGELMRAMTERLGIGPRKYRGATYRKCFVGTEFVDFLMSEYSVGSRAEAVEIGTALHELGLFHHVAYEHGFKDEPLFYRLQADAEPFALNMRRRWTDRVDDPSVTMRVCIDALGTLRSRHTDPTSGLVDYVAIENDRDYQHFQDMACEFQRLDLATLEPAVRTAFAINLYNLLVVHAFVQVGIPRTKLQRASFFDHVGYVLNDQSYSFNDLENGVLRGNRTPPYHLRKPFSKSDPRVASALAECEPRIHFALNCGANSCPPVRIYSAEGLDEELTVAAVGFCESDAHVRCDAETNTLWLSKILSWYSCDFGSNSNEVARSVLQWLRGPKRALLESWLAGRDNKKVNFKLRYFDYDWSDDSSNKKEFQPSKLKLKRSCAIS